MFLALRLDHSNLPEAEGFDSLRPPTTADTPNLSQIHEDASTGHADEAHIRQYGSVVAVFEFCPDSTLWLGDVLKVGRGGGCEGASGDVAQESGAEEDGEDS